MEILEKNEQSLLSRTEVIAKDSYTGSTPSRESIKERLAKALNADKGLLVVKHIYPEFGFGTAKIIAYLYSTKESMNEIEPEYSLKRGEKNKKESKEEAKPEAKKEEKKPEAEKKQETENKKQEKPADNKEQKPEEKKSEDNKKPDEK
ncbi:MAG: hypothetical protein PHV16_03570 [Candidatus Nanoarchaeia archaeon]|nr:hypothetical protein [Candidatus Nanoarchaeia archaeon]